MPIKYIEDGKEIVRYTAKEVQNLPSQTDLSRAKAMSDEELTANALSDPDNPPLDDTFFGKAKRIRLEDLVPPTKEKICLRLDRDVVSWFRTHQKRGYQTTINAVLREFIKAQGEHHKESR